MSAMTITARKSRVRLSGSNTMDSFLDYEKIAPSEEPEKKSMSGALGIPMYRKVLF